MSVEFQKLRSEVMREALLKGWTTPGSVSGWPQIEAERLERWYRKLYRAPEGPTPIGGRLLNHFMLGADPEFILTDGGSGRMDARGLELKAGPAFGADNNGRLVELRPEPSRSALSVVASLWLAMRWMGVFHPKVFDFSWRSGAYAAGDGLGGHIHFGRKREALREREVANLDRVTHLLYTAGVFDREEGRSRIHKSQGGHYGHLGDTRKQPHGWEYRTLPSWIDSPWLAYLALVLGKLVVALPEYVPALSEADGGLNGEQSRAQIRMLLAYFAPLDDDARLAYAILSRRGFPQHAQGLDFKANWGIFVGGPFGSSREASRPEVYPKTIPPRPEDELELMWAMYEGRAPELTPLAPTWSPCTLPKGYRQLIHIVDTRVSPGLGEFAMDLCYHSAWKPTVAMNGYKFCRFDGAVSARFARYDFHGKAEVDYDLGADTQHLYLPDQKYVALAKLLDIRRHIVESRAYPLWFIDKVQPGSFDEWKDKDPEKKSPNFKRVIDTRL